jgi:amino acid transporter
MFVVMTLIADKEDVPSSSATVGAYGTPTIVHFCTALVISAIVSAPWRRLTSVAAALGICAVVALIYALIAVRRARRQDSYKPVLEDWLWHSVFPIAAYAAVLIAAVVLPKAPAPSLFAVGAAVLSLVLIGIHNSWDTVTYLAVVRRESENRPKT